MWFRVYILVNNFEHFMHFFMCVIICVFRRLIFSSESWAKLTDLLKQWDLKKPHCWTLNIQKFNMNTIIFLKKDKMKEV
jgi:hypothetical protein